MGGISAFQGSWSGWKRLTQNQLAVDLVYTSGGGIVGGSSCALQALRWRMRCAAMPRAGRALVFEVPFPVSLLILPESTQAQI